MKIVNHLLVSNNSTESVVQNPSNNARQQINPRFLIVHYTAGDTAAGAISWFKKEPPSNPDRIAAHIVIDQEGIITQLIPFNRRANHAGYSVWDDISSFNDQSIGIELVNPGYCEKMSDGSYRREVQTGQYKTYPSSASNEITKAKHKHKNWAGIKYAHWFTFPQPQMDALHSLSKLLVNEYALSEVLGHDDISPFRKPDPGPAFDWDSLRRAVYDGKTTDVGKLFLVNSADNEANFRSKPDRTSPVIHILSNGYEVGLIETQGLWSKVYLVNSRADVVSSTNTAIKTIGWIHSSLLVMK